MGHESGRDVSDPNGDGKPDWWMANERDRAAMDLPKYDPPCFSDGVYVHEVIPALEESLECDVRLIGVNVDWGDAWDVRIDGERAFKVERSRDESGNTHYQIESEEFARRVREHGGG